MNPRELKGLQVDRLKVIAVHSRRGHHRYWLCVCACGRRLSVRQDHLTGRRVKSCGCWRQETRTTCGGLARTPEHKAWWAMIDRCTNRMHPQFKDYGGRGIAVCERWRGPNGCQNFVADMGLRPTAEHTLDREDNNKGYDAANCRWVPMLVQQNNKRSNNVIEWNGEKLTESQWCRRQGLPIRMIGRRLRAGWPLDIAMTRSPSRRSWLRDARVET